MTWNDIVSKYPEFVQWAVASHGPLPDGEVKQEDYEQLADEYQHYLGG